VFGTIGNRNKQQEKQLKNPLNQSNQFNNTTKIGLTTNLKKELKAVKKTIVVEENLNKSKLVMNKQNSNKKGNKNLNIKFI